MTTELLLKKGGSPAKIVDLIVIPGEDNNPMVLLVEDWRGAEGRIRNEMARVKKELPDDWQTSDLENAVTKLDGVHPIPVWFLADFNWDADGGYEYKEGLR